MSQGLPSYMVADLGRRVRQVGLIEQLLVVVDERRVGRVREADGLAGLAHLEEVDQRRVELGHVEALRLDERRHVEQVVEEDVEAFHADRPDDVRRVAGGDLDLELVGRDAVVVDLDAEVDVLLRGVEVGGELLLGGDLLRLAAAADADEPADDLAAVGADGRGDGLGGDGDDRRCGGGGGRRRGLGRGRRRPRGAEPPHAATTMATIPAAAIKARGPERERCILLISSFELWRAPFAGTWVGLGAGHGRRGARRSSAGLSAVASRRSTRAE